MNCAALPILHDYPCRCAEGGCIHLNEDLHPSSLYYILSISHYPAWLLRSPSSEECVPFHSMKQRLRSRSVIHSPCKKPSSQCLLDGETRRGIMYARFLLIEPACLHVFASLSGQWFP